MDFVKPLSIPNKEDYKNDLDILGIIHTGRFDLEMPINIFHMESVQLILNAIDLFEKGYFDATYYSLRQSIEVSTTMIYLIDITDEDIKKEKNTAWRNIERFPMQKNMLTYLADNGSVFKDFREKLNVYVQPPNNDPSIRVSML